MKNELIIKQNDKITKYKATKKAVKFGNGAIVYVPKGLIGKMVTIIFGAEI